MVAISLKHIMTLFLHCLCVSLFLCSSLCSQTVVMFNYRTGQARMSKYGFACRALDQRTCSRLCMCDCAYAAQFPWRCNRQMLQVFQCRTHAERYPTCQQWASNKEALQNVLKQTAVCTAARHPIRTRKCCCFRKV